MGFVAVVVASSKDSGQLSWKYYSPRRPLLRSIQLPIYQHKHPTLTRVLFHHPIATGSAARRSTQTPSHTRSHTLSHTSHTPVTHPGSSSQADAPGSGLLPHCCHRVLPGPHAFLPRINVALMVFCSGCGACSLGKMRHWCWGCAGDVLGIRINGLRRGECAC